MLLERWGIWLGVILVLVLIAWGPVLVEALDFTEGYNNPLYEPHKPGVPYQPSPFFPAGGE
jgi:hypothetical protein